MEKEIITGKLQAGVKFGFVIPDDREYFGGDFYVKVGDYNGAVDGSRVEAHQIENAKGKKPEAKIVKVLGARRKEGKETKKTEIIEGIYSGGDGNFGFIDVEGLEKGYFVYGHKKNGAKDGDKVKAELIDFKDKKEAIVLEVYETKKDIVSGIYRDNGKFGFVVSDDTGEDIFIAGSRKNSAVDGEEVECEIIKTTGRSPEGVIVKIKSK